MSTEGPASPLSDPVQLHAERRRRERAERERVRADGAHEPVPPHRIRGRHVAHDAPSPAAAPNRRARPPTDTAEGDPDAAYPRIAPGEYEAVLARVHEAEQWGRWTWISWMRIVSPGEAYGVEVPFYLPRKPAEARPRRAWAITAAWIAATGRRPPKNLARLHPRSFLGERVLVVRVADVERDYTGAAVPEAARYSRVRAVLGAATGPGR
jgi:hypothetical protein